MYNRILLIHKKTEIMPFAATWMGLEIIILSEVSQTEKDKCHVITYVWTLGYDTSEPIYKTEQKHIRDIANRVAVAEGAGGEGGKDWEFGISKCKL